MRKSIRIRKGLLALFMLTAIVSLTACAGKKESTNEKKLTIVTTLFPDYDFARQIAGDKAEVKLLLSPGVEAHDYDPSPADIISINKADLFIYTGEYMELWVPGILSSLESDKVTVVDASENISLIRSADEEHHEEDGHSHEYDPHIWTSPKNAIIMVNNILKAIEKKDPANKEYYEKNAEEYISQIKELDSEFAEIAKNAKNPTIYFGGRFAMIYFVKEYGLGYLSAFDSCSSETEPSAKLVADMVDAMKKNGASVVYYEELTDPKSAQAIADEIGGTTLLLHSCHNVSLEDFNNGATYVSLMQQNVINLKTGLGEE